MCISTCVCMAGCVTEWGRVRKCAVCVCSRCSIQVSGFHASCLWGLNFTKQTLKNSPQTLHNIHYTLCSSLKWEQLYTVWRECIELINSSGYLGHCRSVLCVIYLTGVFNLWGEYLQQGGLVVKEDHPVARSFPVQLHYVHPSESVLAWVTPSLPAPGVSLTVAADPWTLCRELAGMWEVTSL